MGTLKDDHVDILMKCRISLDGYWENVPTRFCEMLGYKEEEINGMAVSKLIPPEDQENTSSYFKQLKKGNLDEFESEISLLKRSGEYVSVFMSGMIVRDKKGKPENIICHIQNLSKQKEILHKLEVREQQFNSLFKNNPHPVYYFDLEGNFEGVNDKLVEFTGYSREELLDKGFKEFIVEEDIERTKRHFQRALKEKSGQYEIKVNVKDGVKEIRVTKFPKYSGDEVSGVFGILQDITEEKIALKKLRDSEERWQQLVKQNPQPVQVVQDGKIVYINQAGASYYQAESSEDLIGKSIMDFVHEKDKKKVLNRKNSLEKNESIDPAENKIVLLNGENRYIEAHSIPINYKGKSAIQTVIHDITNLKEKQKDIGKSLKEKETLLKEIHHRVKNNLAMISSMLELQIMQSTDESVTNALRDSQLRIRSIAMIHEKLYQSESLHDISFDIHLKELIQTIRQTYAATGEKIDISFDLDQVLLDIHQVIPCSLIVNEVIVNSFKHAFINRSKGNLQISLSNKNFTVDLTITDDGNGLPDNFDINEQQSLGMTLIQTLASQLEGDIEFSGGLNGKGTLFRLRFEKKPD